MQFVLGAAVFMMGVLIGAAISRMNMDKNDPALYDNKRVAPWRTTMEKSDTTVYRRNDE